MKHATRSTGVFKDSAAFLVHLAHGILLLAGFVGLAMVGSAYLQDESVSFSELGMSEVQAAPSRLGAASPPAATLTAPVGPLAVSLSPEMLKVRDFVSSRYRVSDRALEPVLMAAERSGRKLGIDPLLIVAVMAIESSFNPFAESSMGAQGLMQVIPRFHLDKIGHEADEDALFDPLLNVHVGTLVLREGLQRFGSLQRALQYYGGALSDPNAKYANKVLAMKRRLLTVAGREAATGV